MCEENKGVEPQPLKADYSKKVEDVSAAAMWEAAFNLGKDAIKISLLINSGAVIALLAFYGSIITSQNIAEKWDTVIQALPQSMFKYTIGVLMASLCICIAHFAQIFYYRAQYRQNELLVRYEYHKYDNPFKENYYLRYNKWGNFIRNISIGLCIASYCMFIKASLDIYSALP